MEWRGVDLDLPMELEWRHSMVSFLSLAAGLHLITRFVLGSTLSFRPKRGNAQQSSSVPPVSGPSRETKGRQKTSRDERMRWGVGKLMRNIYVESVDVQDSQEEACEAVTIKNYEFIASYNWKDIEHPTIYVPGLSHPIGRIKSWS